MKPKTKAVTAILLGGSVFAAEHRDMLVPHVDVPEIRAPAISGATISAFGSGGTAGQVTEDYFLPPLPWPDTSLLAAAQTMLRTAQEG